MQSIPETNPSNRYLVCNYLLSNKTLQKVKEDVISFMRDREKDDLYFKFIHWQKKPNETAVLTMYAYADILLPKQFDIIFQIDNPLNYVRSTFVIRQAIINGWTSVNQIDSGHKHIVIVEFENSIPRIFDLLPDFDKKNPMTDNIKLGFCNNKDFEPIKANLG